MVSCPNLRRDFVHKDIHCELGPSKPSHVAYFADILSGIPGISSRDVEHDETEVCDSLESGRFLNFLSVLGPSDLELLIIGRLVTALQVDRLSFFYRYLFLKENQLQVTFRM